MTPRLDIVWLDMEADAQQLRETLQQYPYSRYLVCQGELDDLQGVVQGRDLLAGVLAGEPLNLQAALREPLIVHEGMNTLQVLAQLRQHPIPLAVVVDEYGGVEGIVTASDILASIAGDLVDTADSDAPSVVQEQDGVWLLDGSLSLEELRDLLQSENLPREAGYHTLAGLVLNQLGQIPNGGEQFALEGYQFEVVSMDGHRIQQVRVRCGGAEGPRHA